MWRLALAILVLMGGVETASAQYWGGGPPPYWGGGSPYGRPYYRQPPRYMDWDDDEDVRPRRRYESNDDDEVRSGGERPQIAPISPRRIVFPSNFTPGSIVIDTRGRRLFLVESPESALYYPISVGREGFSWNGTETISRKAEWPDWHPPEEMRERDPSLPVKMTGGLRNPLGAAALYLGKTLYRIHGTNDANSIGRAASSGCFRMLNGHVIDLAGRVDVGTSVQVVSRLPADLERAVVSQVPPPGPPTARRDRDVDRFR